MPGNAAGKSTFRIVSPLVAPRANDPSRMDRGTAAKASSDSEEMNGMIMMPITPPAASALLGAASTPKHLSDVANDRRDGEHGEEAIDDGRNAGEDFEQRLDDRPEALARRTRSGRSPKECQSVRRPPWPAWRSRRCRRAPGSRRTRPGPQPDRRGWRSVAPIAGRKGTRSPARARRTAALRIPATARCRPWSGWRRSDENIMNQVTERSTLWRAR